MKNKKKLIKEKNPVKSVVVLSGGMDSAICLAMTIQKYGNPKFIRAISFSYGQRHEKELVAAKKIAKYFKVNHFVFKLPKLSLLTNNALTNHQQKIIGASTTMVVGRNGLFARLAGIYAHELKSLEIVLGVMGLEAANSGYRDCDRNYFDLMEKLLQKDFDNSKFKIKTPLVHKTKYESMYIAYKLKVLHFLLETTITCYKGIGKKGCMVCPACKLRNQGIAEFLHKHPSFQTNF